MHLPSLFTNRFFDALAKTMLLCAAVHILLLIGTALYRTDYMLLNLFTILDFDLWFPSLGQGNNAFIISEIVGVVIYGSVWYFGTGSKQ